ncbi:hypothetical protein Back2_05790 [Nocardioides baekrokdamisoli]|uniref:Uncharacterized protein n=1 Tax=Nocardioides baekrokdamisoli TaxID=1804624 RepID=A0A3G9ID35_9ACTN|nr:hypothetical protein Back2_05790 [Nocardioides baekrokdamisoli]
MVFAVTELMAAVAPVDVVTGGLVESAFGAMPQPAVRRLEAATASAVSAALSANAFMSAMLRVLHKAS